MRIKLILTACIVTLKITSSQPDSHKGDQAVTEKLNNGESEIRENFQNLFDSIVRSDTEEGEIYHEVLKQNVARQRQDFDAMKQEIKFARNRNSPNRRNSYKRSNTNENVEVIKRQVVQDKAHDSDEAYEKKCPTSMNPIEEKFIERFGNDPRNTERWMLVKDWFLEDGEPKLKKFCSEVHRRAGKGSYPVKWVFLESKLLQFKNEEYFKRLVDVVLYTTRIPFNSTDDPVMDMLSDLGSDGPYLITQGLQSDCVFFLNMDADGEMTLKEHVCEIPIESVHKNKR